jgi:hypothetical protein
MPETARRNAIKLSQLILCTGSKIWARDQSRAAVDDRDPRSRQAKVLRQRLRYSRNNRHKARCAGLSLLKVASFFWKVWKLRTP